MAGSSKAQVASAEITYGQSNAKQGGKMSPGIRKHKGSNKFLVGVIWVQQK